MKKLFWDLGIAVGGVFIGLAAGFVAHRSSLGNDDYAQLLFGVGGTLLTWNLGFSISLQQRTDSILKQQTLDSTKIENIVGSTQNFDNQQKRDSIDIAALVEASKEILEVSTNAAALRGFQSAHTIIQRVIAQTLASQWKTLQPNGHSFAVEARNWAIYANAIYWDELRKFIEDVKQDESQRSALARGYALHWSNPDLWRGPTAADALEAQHRYIEAGGTIRRILVGEYDFEQILGGINASVQSGRTLKAIMRDSSSDQGDVDKLEQYGDVIRLMDHFGIKLYYAQSKSLSNDYVLTPSEHGKFLKIEWNYENALSACRFLETSDRETMNNWNSWRLRAEKRV